MQAILMPIDFSDTTQLMVDWVAQAAPPLDAEVYVLHVSMSDMDDPKQGESALMPKVQEVADRLVAKGCKAQPVLVFGPPAASIIDQIDAKQPSMVVMGSHGRAALYELIMGSVTATVLRSGKCPVVVVPTPKPEAWQPDPADIDAQSLGIYGFPYD